MAITKESLEKKLHDQLEPTYLAVEDFSSGCGLKFDATIVTKKFEGKALLARQRLVNDVIKEEMNEIHAFTQKTYTPDEWERKQQKAAAEGKIEIKTDLSCAGLCPNSKQ